MSRNFRRTKRVQIRTTKQRSKHTNSKARNESILANRNSEDLANLAE